MKKIEAIIRPLRLEAVKTALAEAGVTGLTVSDVRGSGTERSARLHAFRGAEYILALTPKIKIEMTVRDTLVSLVIETVLEQARTGEEGDGKIFVSPMTDAVRVRTGETGDAAV